MNKEIEVVNQNGILMVSSRVVAEDFGKRHGHVLEKIEEKLADRKIGSLNWFLESSYLDAQNKERKEYLMTRDGFSFIIMGFTGAKADEFKIKYIEAFNQMEKLLKEPPQYSVEDMMIHQLQETKKVREDLKALQEEVTDFKNDAPLFAVECEQISNAVRKQGVRLLGGKHSKAYEDRALCNKVYRAIYRELYINFEVTSYKAIKRQYLEKAIEIINDTGLPFKLAEEIHTVNTQMSLVLKKG